MKVIKEDIKNNNYKNLYLLYGSDDYMKNLYKKKLKDGLLGGADEMNYSYFTGEKIDVDNIISMGSTMPFFSDKRIIFIEDSNLFKEANELSEGISTMPDTTYIVFIESAIDKRNKLYKYVSKNGYVLEMNGLTENELMAFVASECKKFSKQISNMNISYMLSRIGYDMNVIHNECEKLCFYASDVDVIEKHHIDEICIVTLENKIFEMLDCIASGKKDRALILYNNLIALKESPIKILSLVTRHYNILYKMYLGNKARVDSSTLASSIGIPPFALKKYGYQLQKFNKDDLLKILGNCLDIEQKSKSGGIDPQIGVEMLIVELSN
jgi:DNA polymerase-3 subunit delta